MCSVADNATDTLSATAVAAILGVSVDTVRRIHPDDLPSWRKTRRGARQYTRADVDRYVRDVQRRRPPA